MGTLLGAFAARNLNRWQDNLISMLTVLAYATPVFWAGLMLIVVFSIKLGWFPTSGMQQVAAFHEGLAKVRDIAHHLVLPAVTLTHVLPGAVHAADARVGAGAVLDGLCGHGPRQGPDRKPDRTPATCCATPCCRC